MYNNDIYYFITETPYLIPYELSDEEKFKYFSMFRKELTVELILDTVNKYSKSYSNGDCRSLTIHSICQIFLSIYDKTELVVDINHGIFIQLFLDYTWDVFHILETFRLVDKFELSEIETLLIFNKVEYSRWSRRAGNLVKKLEPYLINPLFCGEDAEIATDMNELLNCRSYTITKLLEDEF